MHATQTKQRPNQTQKTQATHDDAHKPHKQQRPAETTRSVAHVSMTLIGDENTAEAQASPSLTGSRPRIAIQSPARKHSNTSSPSKRTNMRTNNTDRQQSPRLDAPSSYHSRNGGRHSHCHANHANTRLWLPTHGPGGTQQSTTALFQRTPRFLASRGLTGPPISDTTVTKTDAGVRHVPS